MLTMTNTVDFLEWLDEQIIKKEWGGSRKYSNLGNAAHIDRQVIWGWFNRGKNPTDESLKKLAKAFDITIEEVYRVAGKLPRQRVNIQFLDMTRRYLDIVKSDLSDVHRIASPVDNWRL